MTLEEQKQWQKERKEFWKQVYLAAVASSNCWKTDAPEFWANYALEKLNKKFDPNQP